VGDEIDLVLTKGNKTLAVECKASTTPQLTKGFWKALEDVHAEQAFVVAPVPDAYPIKENVTVCGIADLLGKLRSI